MSNNYKPRTLVCQYFPWRIFRRGSVFYADGRGGEHDLGKHSLDTKDEAEAIDNLRQLDVKMAISLNLAKAEKGAPIEEISTASGWTLYEEHCNRPQVMGGVSHATKKRYRAVRDKHLKFCHQQGLKNWSQVDRKATENYGRWLARKQYADRSLYLEVNLIASVVKWLTKEGRLPTTCRFKLSLSKPTGSDTFCYTREQVTRMISHCQNQPKLSWLWRVIIALASTGMRIGELVQLRRQDVEFDTNTIHLKDERSSSRKRRLGNVRTIKGKRGRTFPMHRRLRAVLEEMLPTIESHVFHGPRGGKLKPDTVRRILVREVIEPLSNEFPTPAGEIGFEHGRVHSFRHYFVSESFRQGASEGQVMEWVGHRDSEMVKLYRHLRADDGQRRMQKIDFFGDDIGSSAD